MAAKHAVYEIASFKALPSSDDSKGRFSALVSVFNNVDFQGDRVIPGAFGKSLAKWRESGDPVPLLWSHEWGNPNAHIGYASADDIEETDDGLLVKDGVIDLDNPFAAQVYRLLKERRVREFSFSYGINDERKGKDGATELLELDLIEAGPTLKGANPSTELLGVKSDLEAAAKGEKSPPWHIEDDHSDCDGFAVVVDETGEVVGCHETRSAAEDHLAALNANVDDASKNQITGNTITVNSPAGVDQEQLKALISEALEAELGTKAGRTISKANEARLRTARDAIDSVLSSLGAEDPEKQHEPEDEANGKSSGDDEFLALKTAVEAAQKRGNSHGAER